MVFAEIVPGKLYQSRAPFDVKELQEKYNINVFVDLAGLSWFYKKELFAETKLLEFPIHDFSVPSRREFKQFIKNLVEIYNQDNSIILIHCQGGRGRSTVCSACLYGVLHNLNGNEAINHIRKCVLFKVPETEEQEYFIHRFIRKYHEED